MANLVGQQLGPYEIKEMVGQGGMASVYKAYHPATDRFVAVKVMLPNMAVDETFVKRFQREAQFVASLQHIHILQVFDYGEQDGIAYLVMPYLPGNTLADKIRDNPLDVKEAVRIFRQLAQALDYAHERGLLHRDIKPSNIMLDESGNALLADFGLTKMIDASGISQLTADSTVVGTPAYMSPEQGQGIDLTPASDLYSLGVVLYEMLTGDVPFTAETPVAVVFKHVSEAPPSIQMHNAEVPDAIAAIVDKALAKNPADRYPTAMVMVNALEKALEGRDMTRPAVTKPMHLADDAEMTMVDTPSQAVSSGSGTMPDHKTEALPTTKNLNDIIEKPKSTPRKPMLRLIASAILLLIAGSGIATWFAVGQDDAGKGDSSSLLFEIDAHDDESVNSLAYTPDGLRLLSGSADNTARMWTIDTQEEVFELEAHGGNVVSVAVHPDGERLMTGGEDAMWFMWDAERGTQEITNFEGQPIMNVTFSPQGTYYVYTTGATVAWAENAVLGTGELGNIRYYLQNPDESPILSLDVSPDESLIATGDEDGVIRLWDVLTGEIVTAFEVRDRYIYDLRFHPEDEIIASAEDDGVIYFSDFSGEILSQIEVDDADVLSLDYSPDGRLLAAGYEDHMLRIWNTNNNELVTSYAGHDNSVETVTFNPDGTRIASGDSDGKIIIWRTPER